MLGAMVQPHRPARGPTGAALAALGIVFGDLGTSPLYTLQTVIGAAGGEVSPAGVLGILSLLFWTILLMISVKYCLLVMRADNHGEGGILALMSLLGAGHGRRAGILVGMGLFGAALLYGDGIITPAISVLSALEGLNVATPAVKPFIMPAAVVILLGLFAIQTFGTARIGALFGPVMSVWFLAIALLGLRGVFAHPEVLAAVDPRHAIGFLLRHGEGTLLVLGGVFLAITGGEALYADMGHVGRVPDPALLVRRGAARPAAELCRARRAAARPSAAGRQPVLPRGAGLGALPDGGARHRRHHHREPGDHHRRLLADAPGHAARLAARVAHPPDLGRGIRADLRALRELDDDAVHRRAHDRLRQLRPAGRRLRHRRLDHHAADHGAAVPRDAGPLEVAAAGGGGGRGRVPRHRPRLLRRQPAEDRRGRRGAAAARRASSSC